MKKKQPITIVRMQGYELRPGMKIFIPDHEEPQELKSRRASTLFYSVVLEEPKLPDGIVKRGNVYIDEKINFFYTLNGQSFRGPNAETLRARADAFEKMEEYKRELNLYREIMGDTQQ